LAWSWVVYPKPTTARDMHPRRGRGLLGSWYTNSTASKSATPGRAAVADQLSEIDSSTSRLSAVDTLPCSSPISPVCRVPSSDNYESGGSRAEVSVAFGRVPSWETCLLESPSAGMSAAAAAREQQVRAQQRHLRAIQRWCPGFDQLNGPVPHAPRFSGKSTMVFLCVIPILGRQEQKHAHCTLAQ
jgi:hypothetical protein